MTRLEQCAGIYFHSSTHLHGVCRESLQTLLAYIYVISAESDYFLFSRLIVRLKFVTEQEIACCMSSAARCYLSNPFIVATGSVSVPRL